MPSPFAVALAALLPLALSLSLAWADLPTITIEAESYTEVTGGTVRVLAREGASGGKCVSYWEDPGVAVTVPFEVLQPGDYCLTLKYSCQWPDTRRSISLDGQVVPGCEDVTLPGTGTWNDFSAMTVPGPDGGRVRLSLAAGAHTLTLTNVDSRGLAWDAAVLHDPALLMADAPLSQAELAALAADLPPPAARLLLGGPGEGDMANVALAGPGMPLAMGVGNLLLAAPGIEAQPGDWTPLTLGPLHLRTCAAGRDQPVPGRSVVIADGVCLYVLAAFVGELDGADAPAPLVAWRNGVPWRLAPGVWETTGEPVASAVVDGVLMSSAGGLTLEPMAQPFAHLALRCRTVMAPTVSVVALKVGPAITPGDSSIAGEVQGDEVLLRSSKQMYPALAAFYRMPQFECRVRADAGMTITCGGEELTLPAP